MLAVPPAILDLLRLHAGAAVGLSVEGGRLIIEPETLPRYTLDELLAQCDTKAALTEEERDWLDMKAVGGEIL